MAHVITQACCNDASCVPVCPVNCIHPTPDEPGYAAAEMLYIDPAVCIDCGACRDVCPVEAIVPDDELSAENARYLEINALHYEQAVYPPRPTPPRREVAAVSGRSVPLRVAIVGSGPAACYAAEELLARRDVDVEVNMFERLPTPWGLVRFGVAPDHPGTRAVTAQFDRTASRNRFALYLNVEIGSHLSHEELLQYHHAVIYAVGASADRRMGVPGEDLPGSVAATDFVGWYNGHPDFAGLHVDLNCERAVVVGNGNVALDVARILVGDVGELARTDIADHALETLAASSVREVVVVGRRGPAQAAYSTPELLALGHMTGVDVLTEPGEVLVDDVSRAALAAHPDVLATLKAEIVAEFSRAPVGGRRRIRLRYLLAPHEVLGDERVTGVRFARTELELSEHGTVVARPTDDYRDLECGLLLRAIGYRGRAIAGVPFDELRATVPNVDGRVVDPRTSEPLAGVYVAGWIKRGPFGVIGTNRKCAGDTVRHLLDDLGEGLLVAPEKSFEALESLVRERQPHVLGYQDWKAIDRYEVSLGSAGRRPRIKLVDVRRMLDVAAGAPPATETVGGRALTG